MLFAVIVATSYEKPVNTAGDLLQQGVYHLCPILSQMEVLDTFDQKTKDVKEFSGP